MGWKRRSRRLVLNPLTLPALLGRERFKRFLNEAGKKLPSFVKYSKYSVWPSFSSLVEWKNLTVNSILSLRSKRVFSLFSSSSSFSFSWSLRIKLEIFVFSLSLSLSLDDEKKRISFSSVSYYVSPCVFTFVESIHTMKCISRRIEICAYVDVGKQLVCHMFDTWQRKG